MPTAFDIETNEPDYNLKAHVVFMGGDLLVAIYGGDTPHIGAVSMSRARPDPADSAEAGAAPSTLSYPNHKEDVLTKEASMALSSALHTNAVVVAGVHFDHIDKHGIERVIENSRRLTGLVVARLQNETTAAK